MKSLAKEFNKLEEIFEDRDGDVFDTVLSFGNIHELKNKLKTLETQGIDVNGIHKSEFHHFCLDQTLNFQTLSHVVRLTILNHQKLSWIITS